MTRHSFHDELVLNKWALSYFKDGTINSLRDRIGDDRFSEVDENGHTEFCNELLNNLISFDALKEHDLRRYDLNIVRYWNEITALRNIEEGAVLKMKYFQYLSLLFTEIYLDKYFNHSKELLQELNSGVDAYNASQDIRSRFKHYSLQDLNKLAFWSATGSGKTLLLHINIKQYLHYYQNGDINKFPDKIILLTPNEGLSRQHLIELQFSGFSFSGLFDKSKNFPFKGSVEVIDINKLGDEMGDKTVAVEAFEGNNLVLVDEGHRGTGTAAGAWMARREILVRGGFAFEYSATFGQAVSKGLTISEAEMEIVKRKAKSSYDIGNVKKLTAEQMGGLSLTSDEEKKAKILATRENYAKNILFDYSYKYFYRDGYGKESLILNLNDKQYEDKDVAVQYFIACLLGFYQQQYLWLKNFNEIGKFNLEKPLWIFVGNTVTGEDSDILKVLRYFSEFLNFPEKSKRYIHELIGNNAILLDQKGNNIFHDRFSPLMGLEVDLIYDDILATLFNSKLRQRLRIVNLKSAKGEILLKVGDADPFGLINIGDDSTFLKSAENCDEFDIENDEFLPSIFGTINKKNSNLNVLIGSRKFTEGWSSWRVSTMGLLNMGKGEGSQIIQLFGRGVRLKGQNYSLKRSLIGERPKGANLEKLETLNIFGINAGYMTTFKEYLKEEGVSTSDEVIQLNFETRANLPAVNLKTLKLKDGYRDNQVNGFKRKHYPELYIVPPEFEGKIKKPHFDLDLYPKLDSLTSLSESSASNKNIKHDGKIPREIFPFFDYEKIYLSLIEYKHQNSWSNLRLDKKRLEEFCNRQDDWYTLLIPKSELVIGSIADIERLQGVLVRLLKGYTDRFYKALKFAYEGQFYDVVNINENDSLVKVYEFEVDDDANGLTYLEKLKKLQQIVLAGDLGEASKWHAGQMFAICFDRHLYYPLFSIEGEVPLKMRPLSFDAPSEVRFVRDLMEFNSSDEGKQVIGERSLYLLRNADNRSRGLGFSLAGNFYPDFLLWLVDDKSGKQWLSFIDPKGLRQVDLSDPKLGLYSEIKTIQKRLNDPDLILNSFIISDTKMSDLLNVNLEQGDLENRNILFIGDGAGVYMKKMFNKLN